MKLLTVVGARPQFIKAAALSREIKKYAQIREVIVHTGQHFDTNMSDIFFKEMEIPKPDYNLKIQGLSHGAMTGRMLEEIEKVIIAEKPDWVVVYGDTNSTLAGALAAKKIHVRVVHIESGLRSFNLKMPEEINRILTDRISDLLFCPTDTAVQNLKAEGFSDNINKIVQTGDIMYDTSLYFAQQSAQQSTIIKKLDLKIQPFVLSTIHRAENTDDLNRLKSLIGAFNTLAKRVNIVLPLHPRTRQILERNHIRCAFTCIDPIGYFDMLELIKNCALVMTDSGGLQKEAYFFKKYCLTLREETEWNELVNHGVNVLVGVNYQKIKNAFEHFFNRPFIHSGELYGEGQSASIMIQELMNLV